MISKEEFVSTINDIKETMNYQHALNGFFRKNKVDGFIFQPDCTSTVLKLLELIFKDDDKFIDYFVFKLDFGKKWEEGCIFDENGQSISMSTSEELYDYICKRGA